MKDEAELYHTELVEKICDLDDDLMMEYLEGNEPSVDAMKAALRKATCECTAVRYAAAPLTETKVSRNFWMQSLSICLLRQTSGYQGCVTRMATRLRDILLTMNRSPLSYQDHDRPVRR